MKFKVLFSLITLSIFFNFISLGFSAESIDPENKEKTETKKKELKEESVEIVIKLKAFYTAGNQLSITAITINYSNGYGDFNINNNTNRNITMMFARIYRFEEEDGKKINLRLANNPNKPGVPLSSLRHEAGRPAVWRFRLYRSVAVNDPKYQYTIDINPKSLFFD